MAQSIAFLPGKNPPRIEYISHDGYEEEFELQLVYGQVEGKTTWEQIYIPREPNTEFPPAVTDHLEQMRERHDVEVQPASRVTIQNRM